MCRVPGEAHRWTARHDGVEDGLGGEGAGGAHQHTGHVHHEPAQVCLRGQCGMFVLCMMPQCKKWAGLLTPSNYADPMLYK